MTKAQQKKFVRGMSATIAADVCKQIAEGKIPENWDGHELRALLHYRHGLSAKMSDPMSDKRTRRARDFRNTIIVNNL
jgi:hypothetical protein